MRTKEITYNIHDRGRKFLGVDRTFDLDLLSQVINSPQTQERVKKGDMKGYYGHWPREVFGMAMREGGIVNGKPISLQPAVRTVQLHCDKDGNITHREEFLSTDDGKLAQLLYEDKVGGWSSAIDAVPGSSPSLATVFYGFDYVQEPNYDTNRGHGGMLLDSLASGQFDRAQMAALLDSVVGEQRGAQRHLLAMFDALAKQHQELLGTATRLNQENMLLVDMAASGGKREREHVLDSLEARFTPPVVMRGASQSEMLALAAMPLQPLQAIKEPSASDSRGDLTDAANFYGV